MTSLTLVRFAWIVFDFKGRVLDFVTFRAGGRAALTE